MKTKILSDLISNAKSYELDGVEFEVYDEKDNLVHGNKECYAKIAARNYCLHFKYY